MPGEPLSIFISYSRKDSELVDRLEADLKARNFYVWVDRRKIEGGQDWEAELQKAIDRCQIMLVVLSPEAMDSKYVRREYRYADGEGKPIIPLNWRTTKVDLVLNDIQWVNFQSNYDQGFSDLQIVLSRQEIAALPPPTKPRTSMNFSISVPEPVLVTPQPAPPPPSVDLNILYRTGVAARAGGNLESTANFWQQVLARDPSFGNGTLKPQVDRLMAELHPIRVQRMRDQAEQAHRSGAWGQEIGAWQALSGLEPRDMQAQQRIPVAQHNQKYAWLYENAVEFAKTQNIAALKEQLVLLWHDAPYYGDPAGLAKYAGLKVPPSFQEASNAQSRTQAAEAEARRKAQEASAAAQRRDASAAAQQRQRESFVDSLDGYWNPAIIWATAFCLWAGVGTMIGALGQSWPWAVGVTVVVALLFYLAGYRMAMGPTETVMTLLVSATVVFIITVFLSTFQYDSPHELSLRSQIVFGIVLGAIGGVVEGGFFLYYVIEEYSHDELWPVSGSVAVLAVPGAIVVWLLVSVFAAIFKWGFGFGYGWAFPLLVGFPIAFIGISGLFASIYICGPTIRKIL